MIASGFTWFHFIPGVEDDTLLPFVESHTSAFVTAWFVCAVLIVFGFIARGRLIAATAQGGLAQYEADDKLSIRTVAELLVGFIRNMMNGALPEHETRRWMWLVGGLFTYIFTCNILGIFPGMAPPTDVIDTNVGMALGVMLVYWFVGLTVDAKSFVSHIVGPMLAVAVILVPLELLTLLVIRPLTLALRLTGNMFADHTVFAVMSGLMPPLAPVPFLMLAILVSSIQAFVFALLTTIYISLSLPHGDHDDHH